MPPVRKTSKLSETSFNQLLERETKAFGEKNRPLLIYQQNRLQSCLQLLDEDILSAGLSEAQRFGKLKVRNFLMELFNCHGDWAFLLCATAASISRIQKIPSDRMLGIHQWFENAPKFPNGLYVKAAEVCDEIFKRKYCSGLLGNAL